MKHLLTLSLLAILQVGWAQSEYCLDGTVWDAAVGGCIPESNCLLDSDLDGDGVVGTGDLLLLLTEFGGSFPDADSDGICDDNDDCVGEIDECGVCNGLGPTVPIIESIQILYDSVYAPQIDQWLVFEVGADTTFSFECNEGASGYVAPNLLPMTSDEQRVLTEAFVAHQDGYSPSAIAVMNELIDNHPSRVVPVAIHAGALASTNNQFPMDWTTPEGDEFWNDLNVGVSPIFRVNRENHDAQLILTGQLEDVVNSALEGEPEVGMQLVVNPDVIENKIHIHVHSTWFADGFGEYRLALLVLENQLVGSQYWYATTNPPPPSGSDGIVSDYEHNSVLRGSVTGAKGDVVFVNPEQGDEQQFNYEFAWNSDWVLDNCDVVAVLTEEENGRVVQVSQRSIVTSCGAPISYQGYNYATVLIGDQCWLQKISAARAMRATVPSLRA